MSTAEDRFELLQKLRAATVEALLDAGADVNVRDSFGSTPLHVAALWNRVGETIGTLMTHGADAKARDNDGHTAVEVASNNGHSGVEVQIMALEAGVESGWVEPNAKGGDDG